MCEHLPDNGGCSGAVPRSLQTLPLPATSGDVFGHQKVLIVLIDFWICAAIATQQVLYGQMNVYIYIYTYIYNTFE